MDRDLLRRRLLTPTSTPTSDTALAPPARQSASSARTCQPGTKAERYCFAKNTLPPQPMRAPAPPPPMDANGCVAAAIVHDGCNGVDDVLSGPAAAGGQCCYQICRGIPAPCGRPLVMTANGAPRVARAVRTDAGPREAAMPSPLGHALRTALRDASFVRFTLELLAVGAPRELVTDAQRAGLDESAHAKACFALAQHHDPEHASYEAGPLDLAGFTLRTSRGSPLRARTLGCSRPSAIASWRGPCARSVRSPTRSRWTSSSGWPPRPRSASAA